MLDQTASDLRLFGLVLFLVSGGLLALGLSVHSTIGLYLLMFGGFGLLFAVTLFGLSVTGSSEASQLLANLRSVERMSLRHIYVNDQHMQTELTFQLREESKVKLTVTPKVAEESVSILQSAWPDLEVAHE